MSGYRLSVSHKKAPNNKFGKLYNSRDKKMAPYGGARDQKATPVDYATHREVHKDKKGSSFSSTFKSAAPNTVHPSSGFFQTNYLMFGFGGLFLIYWFVLRRNF